MPYRIGMDVDPLSACTYYRSVLPIRHCADELAKEGIQLVAGMTPDCQAWVSHRLILSPVPSHIKLVQGFDDHPWDVPEWNPEKETWMGKRREIQELLRTATSILVTTDRLAKEFGYFEYDRPVTVLPNLVDVEDFAEPTKQEPNCNPVVLFAGSNSHRGDLVQLAKPIKKLADEFPRVHWIFWGCRPPEELLYKPVMPYSWKPFPEYFARLHKFSPTIALCPLAEHPFNECKSPLKWMEMTMAGAMAICSPLEPYINTVALCATDWHQVIGYYLRQDEYSIRVTLRGKQGNVIDHHSWQGFGKQPWLDFFRGLAA